jgi:glutamate N-acetyltransferase/amino-acid N-acetyltransferase
MFTRNKFKAAPLLYDMALLERTQTLQGVVINTGNANAVTGEKGLRDAEQMARLTESACDLPPDSIFVMSTGVIGRAMSMDKIATGIREASQLIKTPAGEQGQGASEAILTTDLVSKENFVKITISGQPVHIGGMAKGSGMIHPNMGTMLAVVVTDANIAPSTMKFALQQATNASFNMVTVDGDTSTNDTILLLASGEGDHPIIDDPESAEFQLFTTALTDLCIVLAKAIARDGEGATKLVEITVRGATTPAEAETAAKAIATSPLVKTAIFGNDPNWGRILAAVGYSGITVDPMKVSLKVGKFQLVIDGEPTDFDAVMAHDWLIEQTDLNIEVDLKIGQAQATVWTCDFSYKYVEINAEYHT